jgi:hypothetical protein
MTRARGAALLLEPRLMFHFCESAMQTFDRRVLMQIRRRFSDDGKSDNVAR